MYVLTVELKIRSERLADFQHELSNLRTLIEREPDCLGFDVLQNDDCPHHVLLVETWSSRAYFENVQMKRPYYALYFARVHPMWNAERQLHHWSAVAP